jgi:hypothetical protein
MDDRNRNYAVFLRLSIPSALLLFSSVPPLVAQVIPHGSAIEVATATESTRKVHLDIARPIEIAITQNRTLDLD